jgi:hypothetical protein
MTYDRRDAPLRGFSNLQRLQSSRSLGKRSATRRQSFISPAVNSPASFAAPLEGAFQAVLRAGKYKHRDAPRF